LVWLRRFRINAVVAVSSGRYRSLAARRLFQHVDCSTTPEPPGSRDAEEVTSVSNRSDGWDNTGSCPRRFSFAAVRCRLEVCSPMGGFGGILRCLLASIELPSSGGEAPSSGAPSLRRLVEWELYRVAHRRVFFIIPGESGFMVLRSPRLTDIRILLAFLCDRRGFITPLRFRASHFRPEHDARRCFTSALRVEISASDSRHGHGMGQTGASTGYTPAAPGGK
jgi:hypothetical protein